MTLPRLEAVMRRWQRIPSPGVSAACLARAWGMEQPGKAPAAKAESDFDDLMSSFGGASKEAPAWLKEERAKRT